MPVPSVQRETFSSSEIDEIRQLLTALPDERLAIRRMSAARLRHLGVPVEGRHSLEAFEALQTSGAVRIDDGLARAVIPRRFNRCFRVAVGVTGDSVTPGWDAFGQRYQWFGKQPRSVSSGDHLFVLAVDRWRSAVVGLYETVSSGAERLPASPDPDRWPWALGVRPVAAIPPPDAVRVDGQVGPQSGLPISISDRTTIDALYAAVADSRPPPGPTTSEQRVQELEEDDVMSDVLDAVAMLGGTPSRSEVLALAERLGDWSEKDLAARAWYTGSGDQSHIRRTLAKALERAFLVDRTLIRTHGRFRLAEERQPELGAPYRIAARNPSAGTQRSPLPDIAALDRATRHHMLLQDTLAAELHARGLAVRSPRDGEPPYDLLFLHQGQSWVVEVKGGDPPPVQQLRVGCGQVLEYCHQLRQRVRGDIRAALMLEGAPPEPWPALAADLDVALLDSSRLASSLTTLMTS